MFKKLFLPALVLLATLTVIQIFSPAARSQQTLSVNVTSPSAGAQWVRGETYTIRWTLTTTPSTNGISLSLKRVNAAGNVADQNSWETFIGNSNATSFDWSVPSALPIGNYKMLVQYNFCEGCYDFSEQFQIVNVGGGDGGSVDETYGWRDPLGSEEGQCVAEDLGCYAPINASGALQQKKGPLYIDWLQSLSDIIVSQRLGVKVNYDDSFGNGVLSLKVNGAVGATQYCDESGNNCVSGSSLGTTGSGGGGSGNGDNLGNHTATQTLKMNGHRINGDGSNDEGLYVDDNGHVTISGKLTPDQLCLRGSTGSRICRETWPADSTSPTSGISEVGARSPLASVLVENNPVISLNGCSRDGQVYKYNDRTKTWVCADVISGDSGEKAKSFFASKDSTRTLGSYKFCFLQGTNDTPNFIQQGRCSVYPTSAGAGSDDYEVGPAAQEWKLKAEGGACRALCF